MKILVLDPGLSARLGHNAAIAEELGLELRGRPGVELTFAGSSTLIPADFEDLTGTFLPAFRLDGYAHFGAGDFSDPQRNERIRTFLASELQALRPSSFDVILMPTAYPLHLQAVADSARLLGKAQFQCGLLMPASFWANDAAAFQHLATVFEAAILQLQGANCLFYTETGRFALGDASVRTPVLLPPVSAATASLMETLAQAGSNPAEELRVGYFGSPFTSKGFNVLLETIARGLPPHVRIVLRLPPGHAERCATLRAQSPQVDATSRAMSNGEFLREMASVDVVFGLYDPAHYSEKMSGLIPEAICLGRPVLLSAECTSLVAFLDQHAPGSFVSAGYDVASLGQALALPADIWRERAQRAAASAPVVRALKSASRYLTIAGAGGIYRPQIRPLSAKVA